MNPKEKMAMEAITRQQQVQQLVNHVINHLDDYPDVVCIACGGRHFDETKRAKMISQFDPANSTGKEQVVHFSCFVCRECCVEIHLTGEKRNIMEQKVTSKTIIPS